MAEQRSRRIQIRRISGAQFAASNAGRSVSAARRTVVFEPPGGGTFTANDLSNIIPPPNARAFKIIRMMGGRYNRPDNPQGLGTEGPFSMSDYPDEEADLLAAESSDIVKVIFDVSE